MTVDSTDTEHLSMSLMLSLRSVIKQHAIRGRNRGGNDRPAGPFTVNGIIFDADVIGPWVASRVKGMAYHPGTSTGIARVSNGQIVAAALYQDCNGANVFAHIAVDRGGLNRRFLSLIFDYPFRQLGVKRITGVVASSNAAARKLDEHLGFELEAILHDAHPDGDLLIYKMTADKCRWLTELPYEPA